ncbi:hypothetical protein J3458_002707 [Metarhizium acridum]|uniref:uncharacterized protein n=1 Tax=Metarhizium acridum TaxID=92637 RepID=UPI001C6C0B6B|nr:hypothetical protein J3458_002707 [Metarhizium acridum]
MILDPGTDLDQGQLETGAEQAIANVAEQTSAEIVRRQRKYLLSLPVKLKDNATTFLPAAGEAYKSQFSERIKDEKSIQIYPNTGIN